jgi:hypothetical protein
MLAVAVVTAAMLVLVEFNNSGTLKIDSLSFSE